jgi:hypothetical protein
MAEEKYLELETVAIREGFSVSVIVRHLVNRFLEDRRRLQGGRR